MIKKVCSCIKNDSNGEIACKYAVCDPSLWDFSCGHECVIAIMEKLRAEQDARREAEMKLDKYRKAIKPFVDNCRAVIEAVDNKKENEK